MEKYTETNQFIAEEYAAVEVEAEGCDDVKQLEEVAIKMFTSDYAMMPPPLGIKILRRFVEISLDKQRPKAFLGRWLHLYGMEWENEEEGVRLLQEVEDPDVRITPWLI